MIADDDLKCASYFDSFEWNIKTYFTYFLWKLDKKKKKKKKKKQIRIKYCQVLIPL